MIRPDSVKNRVKNPLTLLFFVFFFIKTRLFDSFKKIKSSQLELTLLISDLDFAPS